MESRESCFETGRGKLTNQNAAFTERKNGAKIQTTLFALVKKLIGVDFITTNYYTYDSLNTEFQQHLDTAFKISNIFYKIGTDV